ncbi:UNVERIFIED_CONTAM: hypothetical protein GTU68_015192 [Idotea baltica]|nr:hypothetical protein [Idotea baltica]
MAYSEKVIQHYENPSNVGSFAKDEANVGTGLVGAPSCGDVMRLQIKVNPETDIIEDAKFKTFGCLSAIAASSLATEKLKGKNISEASQIKNSEIAKELSLPPVKIHCSVLAEDAIKKAVEDADANEAGEEVVSDKNVTVFIKPLAVMYLLGTVLDFHQDKIKSGFVFNNPNEKGSCGCGKSFTV